MPGVDLPGPPPPGIRGAVNLCITMPTNTAPACLLHGFFSPTAPQPACSHNFTPSLDVRPACVHSLICARDMKWWWVRCRRRLRWRDRRVGWERTPWGRCACSQRLHRSPVCNSLCESPGWRSRPMRGVCTSRQAACSPAACSQAQWRSTTPAAGRSLLAAGGARSSGGGAWRRRQRGRAATRCSVAVEEPPPPVAAASGKDQETDVVVIGSGIGGECRRCSPAQLPLSTRPAGATTCAALLPPGLCAAALLARYGYRVTVCESHYHAGGAAHGFEAQGYSFDAGPSFYAGLSGGQQGSPGREQERLAVKCAALLRHQPARQPCRRQPCTACSSAPPSACAAPCAASCRPPRRLHQPSEAGAGCGGGERGVRAVQAGTSGASSSSSSSAAAAAGRLAEADLALPRALDGGRAGTGQAPSQAAAGLKGVAFVSGAAVGCLHA